MPRLLPPAGALTALPILAALFLFAGGPARPQPRPVAGLPAAVDRSYGQLPLAFEPDAGRSGGPARFIARGRGYMLFLTPRGSVLWVQDAAAVRTTLVGGRPGRMSGEAKLPGVVNWYVGVDRSRWRTALPTFGRVVQRGVYPGIDVVYHGRPGRLEYDFRVAPGADAGRVAMAFGGARAWIDKRRDLVLRTAAGIVRQPRPLAYQMLAGHRVDVPARFVLDGRQVKIGLGRYDASRQLLIDPIVAYSSYLGTGGNEEGEAVAVDSSGDAYFAGEADSAFPGTATSNAGSNDIFVVKLNPAGSAALYTTYFGGSGYEAATDIAVNGSGEAYVVGKTQSSSGISTTGVLQDTFGGVQDGFVAKLGSDGARAWTTYLGGTKSDDINAIALDASGNPIVGGSADASGTLGTALASTLNAVDSTAAAQEGFIAQLSMDGTTKTWLTYVGGSSDDSVRGVDLDPSGNVYAAGNTTSTDLSVTNGSASNPNDPIKADLFMTKLNSTATSRTYATYVGGNDFDFAEDLSVDSAGRAAMVGYTSSANFPSGNVDPVGAGYGQVPFFFELDASNSGSPAVTGGGMGVVAAASGEAYSVAHDSFDNLYVAGELDSGALTPLNAPSSISGSNHDGFVFERKMVGVNTGDVYRTYIGGAGADHVFGLAVDDTGGTYLTGETSSSDFPVASALQDSFGGGTWDAWVSKLVTPPPTIQSQPASLTTSTTAAFTYNAVDTGMTFKCGIDTVTLVSCPTAGKTFDPVTDGSHTFRVQAFDFGGSSDGSVATYTWTVDTTPPDPFALVAPAADTQTGTQPEFSWEAASDPDAGIKDYTVVIDGQTAGTTATCCKLTPATPLVQGQHSWKVVARDNLDHTRDSETRSFTVIVPLAARFTIAPNPALAGRPVTFDGSGSADAAHSIAKYEWDLDGDKTFEVDGGTTPTTTKSYSTPGTVQVSLRVTDTLGQTATTTTSLRVTAPPIATGQLGVTINTGAQFTRTPDVVVSAKFPSSTTSMLFSNDGGFLAPATFPPQADTNWKLDSSGPERLPKTIYVRFLIGTFTSETFQDDIILDEIPPKVEQAQIAPVSGAASAVHAAKAKVWLVKVKATDSNSGVDKVQVTANKRKPGRLLAYKTKLKVKSPTRPKFVRARDRAGNFSPWKKFR